MSLRSLWVRWFRRREFREPRVGPVLGSVTETSARFFCQDRDVKYAHLVVRGLEDRKVVWTATQMMNANFCNSTVFAIDGELRKDTVYEYQAFVSDTETNPGWVSSLPTYEFGTMGDVSKDEWNVVTGSCRYILRVGPLNLWDTRSDKAFRSMSNLHRNTVMDAAIFTGDQIYADDLNDLKNDVEIEQFIARYEGAFSTPYFREFAASVPIINTLDDHEIEDNYPSKVDRKKMLTKVPAALHTYETFQLSYSHLFRSKNNRIVGRPDRYWYSRDCGLVDYFVTDTRTERNPGIPNVVSDEQFQELLNWLVSPTNAAYKLIISAVPLFPKGAPSGNVFDDTNDKWWYSEEQASELLDAAFAVSKSVQPVLFAGDIHMSCVATLSERKTDRSFVSVISSPIFWPYPNPASKFLMRPGVYGGRNLSVSKAVTKDNFAAVKFLPDKMIVKFMPRKCNNFSDALMKKTIAHQSTRSYVR